MQLAYGFRSRPALAEGRVRCRSVRCGSGVKQATETADSPRGGRGGNRQWRSSTILRRWAAEQFEAARIATEHLEPAARIAAEQFEAARIATEHLEPAVRIAVEHLEPAARIAAEQSEAVRIAAEQLELVRVAAAEQLELARIAAERFEPSLLAEQLRLARTAAAEWFEPSLQQFKAVRIAAERFEPSLLAEQCEQLLAGLPRLSPELFGGAWDEVAEAVERLERTEAHAAATADPDRAVEEMAKDVATVHKAAPSEVQEQVKTRLFGLVVRRLTEIAKHPTVKKYYGPLRLALSLLSFLGVTPTLPELMTRMGVADAPGAQDARDRITGSAAGTDAGLADDPGGPAPRRLGGGPSRDRAARRVGGCRAVRRVGVPSQCRRRRGRAGCCGSRAVGGCCLWRLVFALDGLSGSARSRATSD